MNITPLGERVLIKQTKKEERTKGGIYIPDSAQKERKEGTVMAVGMTKEGNSLPLKAGDKVLYGGDSHEEIEVNGGEYVLVEFKDILAKIE